MDLAAAACGPAERAALQRIDEACAQLQQSGNYLEALECMERGLVLRQHFFGAESEEARGACRAVGGMCNLLAMSFLQRQDFCTALELLRKAEVLTDRDGRGTAETFNNFACYYRRAGKLRTAMRYLRRALRIEARLGHVGSAADTHLNACAVLSQLGRHQSALEHAQDALLLLQEELSGRLDGVASPAGADIDIDTVCPEPPRDRIAVLAIAYHNAGVEQEFLQELEGSLASYRKGVRIGERFLGVGHAITRTLKSSLAAARSALTRSDPEGRARPGGEAHAAPLAAGAGPANGRLRTGGAPGAAAHGASSTSLPRTGKSPWRRRGAGRSAQPRHSTSHGPTPRYPRGRASRRCPSPRPERADGRT